MRRTTPPRSIAVARRSDHVQPAAILSAIGIIATLMLAWAGMASGWPGLH